MRVHVQGVDSSYYIDIERMINLFFSEAKVVQDLKKPGDRLVLFSIEVKSEKVRVTAEWREETQHWRASHEKKLPPPQKDAHRNREIKQVAKSALLQVLTKVTGRAQPWGILTGVRPTKLFHSMLLKGYPLEQVQETLLQEYLLLPEKVDLLTEIVHRQRSVLPDLYQLDREVSLYIGIPFCPTKCAYCTFPAYAIGAGSVDAFLQGLHEEIEAVCAWLGEQDLEVTTVYFGGGTPTSLTAAELDRLFAQLKKALKNGTKVREWTVEAGRPDTIDEEKLAVFKKWQVDRISINPQSFKEETLQAIGRHHTVAETLEKYQLARQLGMQNINMDLIIGLPGEGMDTFQQSLEVIEELKPESLTVHTLSFKRGSAMTNNKRRYPVSSGEEVAAMVQLAQAQTATMGYVPYYLYRQKNILGNQENVGYALPGHESIYNVMIMEEKQTIIGLGCGAVSKIIPPGTSRIIRFPNPKEPQAYINTFRQMIPEKLAALEEAFQGRTENKKAN